MPKVYFDFRTIQPTILLLQEQLVPQKHPQEPVLLPPLVLDLAQVSQQLRQPELLVPPSVLEQEPLVELSQQAYF